MTLFQMSLVCWPLCCATCCSLGCVACLPVGAWYSTHHCTAIGLIVIGHLGAMQTRSSDVMHHRIVTPTSGCCTILPSPAGTEWQLSADMLMNCLCISSAALVCQPPFCRKRPLFYLQWVKKLRVINQLWAMRSIAHTHACTHTTLGVV